MAFWTTALETCNRIKIASSLTSHQRFDENGFMEALNAKDNIDAGMGNPEMQEFNDSEGRNITTYVNRYQRVEPTQITVGANPTYCVSGADKPKYQKTVSFSVADRFEYKIPVSNSTFRNYCKDESKANFLNNEIRSGVNAIVSRIEQALTTQFLALRGTLVGGGLIVGGDLFQSNIPTLRRGGFISNIRQQARNMEMKGGLYIVGDGIISEYADTTESGLLCCNDSGYDLDNALGKTDTNFYRSPNVQTAMGANPDDVLVWGAGSVLPIYWIKNRGQYDTLSTKEQRDLNEYQGIDTHIIAKIGKTDKDLPIDMSIRFDNCGTDAVYIITLSTHAKITMEIPTETFAAGSRLFGTNGAMLGRPTAI